MYWIHPVGPPAHPYCCPCCRVNNILRNLKGTFEKWKKEGGPIIKIPTHRYDKLRDSYSYFIMELAKYMWQLELLAEKGHAWEVAYPGSLAGLYIQSSKAAFAVARRDIPFCEVLESNLEVMAKSASRRSVCFVDGIRECPIRPISYMRRSSNSYKSGCWAALVGQEWLDTSFQSDQWYGKPDYEVELDRRWFDMLRCTDRLDSTWTKTGDGRI